MYGSAPMFLSSGCIVAWRAPNSVLDGLKTRPSPQTAVICQEGDVADARLSMFVPGFNSSTFLFCILSNLQDTPLPCLHLSSPCCSTWFLKRREQAPPIPPSPGYTPLPPDDLAMTATFHCLRVEMTGLLMTASAQNDPETPSAASLPITR